MCGVGNFCDTVFGVMSPSFRGRTGGDNVYTCQTAWCRNTDDHCINILIVLLRQVHGSAFILKRIFRRLAAMLRQLAQFHAKDPNNLFMVRIAQGLTHLGKGTLTLCPYHSDRQLLSPVALAGLLSTLIGFLDVKNSKYF